MMQFELIDLGGSRSMPENDPWRAPAGDRADVLVIAGGDAAARAGALAQAATKNKALVLVELGTECLGFHAGEGAAAAANVIGFARFELGALAPTPLVELVTLPVTSAAALQAARALLETASFEFAVCSDVPGRIVDSLLRPYLNSALQSVDEGLAAPADMDQALRLGLGFPKGPMELLETSGIAAHYHVTRELHEALGSASFLPARRARVHAMRAAASLGEESRT
jgi:3-hydroxybutyryl-CoA dehydrogenase